MGAAALQKYIGSLGGIGTSGVGSSSSYAPKELNKEVMPEKVILELCIVSSNADRPQVYFDHLHVQWFFLSFLGG